MGIVSTGVSVTSSSGSSGFIDFGQNASIISLKATSAGTVKINGFTIAVAQSDHYSDIQVDATGITILTGTIDYVAVG